MTIFSEVVGLVAAFGAPVAIEVQHTNENSPTM